MRVVLADDHELAREGVKALFRAHSDEWTICGEADNGQEAVELVAQHQPDLIVLDLSMPVMNGMQAAAKIRQISPNTKIIMLSMHNSSYVAEEALRVGANAYVTKSEAGAGLMRAINALFRDSAS